MLCWFYCADFQKAQEIFANGKTQSNKLLMNYLHITACIDIIVHTKRILCT